MLAVKLSADGSPPRKKGDDRLKVASAVSDFVATHQDFTQSEVLAYTSMLLACWGLQSTVTRLPSPPVPSYLKVTQAGTTLSSDPISTDGSGSGVADSTKGAGKQGIQSSLKGDEEKEIIPTPPPLVSISSLSKGNFLRKRAEEALRIALQGIPEKVWKFSLKEQNNSLPKKSAKYHDSLKDAVKKHRKVLKAIRKNSPRDLGTIIANYNSLVVVLVRFNALLSGTKEAPKNEEVLLLEGLDAEGIQVLGQLVEQGLETKQLGLSESSGLLFDPSRPRSSKPPSEDDIVPASDAKGSE